MQTLGDDVGDGHFRRAAPVPRTAVDEYLERTTPAGMQLEPGDYEDASESITVEATAIEWLVEEGCADEHLESALEILSWSGSITATSCERPSSDARVTFAMTAQAAIAEAEREARFRTRRRDPDLLVHLVAAVRAATMHARRMSAEARPARHGASRRQRSRSPGGDDSEPEPPLDRPHAAGEVAA